MHLAVKLSVIFVGIFIFFILATVLNAANTNKLFSKDRLKKAANLLENNITSDKNVLTYKSKEYSCKSIPGAVIASTAGMNASWPRDTALVMGTITRFYKEAVEAQDKKAIQKYGNYLYNYVSFLKVTVPQMPPDHAKFYIDGKKYPWMNQADGPALRVITLFQISQIFISHPQAVKISHENKTVKLDKDFVLNNFFNSKSKKAQDKLIIYEADFMSKNWQKKTIDLWEESSAHHFFSELVQMKACLNAAVLAHQLGYNKLSKKYSKTSYDICKSLKSFYNFWKYYGIRHNLKKPLGGFYCYTENKKPSQKPFKGTPPKKWYEKWQRGSGLNSSSMLGIIYANMFSDFQKGSLTYNELSKDKNYKKLLKMYKNGKIGVLPTSDKVIQTIYHYQNAFTAKSLTPYAEGLDVYKVNNEILKKKDHGALVGRYPGDNYNGIDWSKVDVDGNPWILTTCGLANYYYTLAREYEILGKINIPENNSKTPDVVNFFRQLSGDKNIEPGEYSRDSKTFEQIIKGLIKNADDIIRTVIAHIKPYDFHMSEQLNRNTGEECSYKNLSWSYSSYLDAYAASPYYKK